MPMVCCIAMAWTDEMEEEERLKVLVTRSRTPPPPPSPPQVQVRPVVVSARTMIIETLPNAAFLLLSSDLFSGTGRAPSVPRRQHMFHFSQEFFRSAAIPSQALL